MHPEFISHEEATGLLNELAQSGKTVYFSLVFGSHSARVQVSGPLGKDSYGEYFIANDALSCVLNPDKYGRAFKIEDPELFGLGFAEPLNAPDQLTNVLVLVDKSGVGASRLPNSLQRKCTRR